MARRRRAGSSTVTFGLGFGEGDFHKSEEQLQAVLAKSFVNIRTGAEGEGTSFSKSILNVLNGPGNDSVERLAFEVDPAQRNSYAGVYKTKLRLVPDTILKRIAIQDSLVATIVRARQQQMSAFGRPRNTRFGNGFIIDLDTGVTEGLSEADRAKLNQQAEEATARLSTCGDTRGLTEDHQETFSEWLSLSTRSALVCGRIACEVVYVDDPRGGVDEYGRPKKMFHHFVATDAGTIFKATTGAEEAQQSVRDDAYNLLCQITGKDLVKERHEQGEYVWVQVVEGVPRQVFTADEMRVRNFYKVPDVELDGYPVTPIDTVISAITTHINITTHNKLYFQSGRASRGMLVIKSDDVNPSVVHNIKQQFNASINNVNNSWRMPVFGCGSDEEINWQAIDSGGGRDMEFQYLTDMNAREILSAFMMSPDELPGWSYLSRGTNNQALSESNNEYKLEAARDLGIRPLISTFEDFINAHLLPLIDPDLAVKAKVRLVGLDSDNPEKEAVRTTQDMQIWMAMDDVMERVEKKPIGKAFGGTIPLNPAFQAILDKYFTVGQILERFCDVKGAAQDPTLNYRRDAFWFNQVEAMQQAQQAQQAQQQAQQAQMQGGAPGGGAPPAGGGGGQQPQAGSDAPPPQTEKQKTAASDSASGTGASPSGGAPAGGANDLARSIDQAFEFMSKNEEDLPADKRRLLAQHRKMLAFFKNGAEDDSAEAIAAILEVAKHHSKGKRTKEN
jgi:hypothetical protein